MLYAREVIALMADPVLAGREWRIGHIVGHVSCGRSFSKPERERVRKGVRRVLEALIAEKVVEYRPGRANRSPTLYRWKSGT